jgi:hypothetical protein
MIFDGTRDTGLFGVGHVGIAKGGENALPQLSFWVEERFDELDDRGAFDGFGAEIHAGENGKAGVGVKYTIRHCGSIFQ